jgi:hypothetical protein
MFLAWIRVQCRTPRLVTTCKSLGERPPWLVVDHELASVVVARWPGRLWAVEVVDPIRADDLAAAGHPPLRKDIWYTRAAAVKVLHEMPVATLFGNCGAEVCAVIEAATGLTLERAIRLANARHRDAGGAQTRVRKHWLSRDTTLSHKYGDDLDGMLAVAEQRTRSPVGAGLLVICGEVRRSAEAIGGSSVWVIDADQEDAWLAEPWSKASAALIDAALAFGAPDLMRDSNILATAWRHAIGPDPT